MKRRSFLGSCALVGGAASLGCMSGAFANAPVRLYARTRLVDAQGRPVRARALAAETNYVFHYPYASTPCFLLRLPKVAASAVNLKREDGASYAWTGGVGPERSVVAFSAICAHKLAYPTRDVSFIRYQKDKSATSAGSVIHCCADHSVYDPSAGARVVSGPAPQPLAAIVLEHDPATDAIHALGTQGPEQFDAFFRKYEFKLGMEYGSKAKAPVADRAVVSELATFCKTTIQC